MLRLLLHHQNELLIALAALVVIALVIRLVIGNPRSARHRVRILRWASVSTCGRAPVTPTSSNWQCAGHAFGQFISAGDHDPPCRGGRG
jgi:hypothetical protein